MLLSPHSGVVCNSPGAQTLSSTHNTACAHSNSFNKWGFFALPTSMCNFTTSTVETVFLFGKYKSLIVNKLGVAHIFV